jgi:3-oxoacyl-[acyl-carrier protein] reductase
VAFITGASKGVGKATARLLAEEGSDVALTTRGRDELAAAAREIAEATGRKVLPLQGDMGVWADVERSVAEAIDSLGKIDPLVTCAGSSPGGLHKWCAHTH